MKWCTQRYLSILVEWSRPVQEYPWAQLCQQVESQLARKTANETKYIVRGCPLTAIKILEFWILDAYISTICITPMHGLFKWLVICSSVGVYISRAKKWIGSYCNNLAINSTDGSSFIHSRILCRICMLTCTAVDSQYAFTRTLHSYL